MKDKNKSEVTQKKKGFTLSGQVKENLTGYLYILPAFFVIGLFGLFPIGYAIYMSLFNWRVTKGAFTGLANFTKIFGDWLGLLLFLVGIGLLVAAYWVWNNAFRSYGKGELIAKLAAGGLLIAMGVFMAMGWARMTIAGDEDFLQSMIVTLYYAVITVPMQLILALVLAYILFQNIKGKEIFRMLYFLPYVTPVVSTAVVFRTIFSPRETSLANTLLGYIGIAPQKWLFESRPIGELLFGWKIDGFFAGPSLALLTIILFGIWTFVGYNTVIFLAGLGSISKEVYEAAEIDGASSWGLFRHITIPLISPVTFYLFLISFIGTFKAFNHLFVMQEPSAQNTVQTASVEIFNVFYKANNFGYAAAQAIVLFLVILGLTFAQNKILGEKVFYG